MNTRVQYLQMSMGDAAGMLYDGGWRAGDRRSMIEMYNFTDAEADAICELLKEYEIADKADKE